MRRSRHVALAVLLACGSPAVVGAQPGADAERNKQVIRQHLETMSRGEWRQAAEFFADDVRHHLGVWQDGQQRVVGGKPGARAILTDNLADIFATFPDWKMQILDLVAEGDVVVARCRVSGTHEGIARKDAPTTATPLPGQPTQIGQRRTR